VVALAVVVAHTVVVHTLWTPYALLAFAPLTGYSLSFSHTLWSITPVKVMLFVGTMLFSTIIWLISGGIRVLPHAVVVHAGGSPTRWWLSTRCENLSRAFVLSFPNP